LTDLNINILIVCLFTKQINRAWSIKITPSINRIRQRLIRFGLGPLLLAHQRLHPSHICPPPIRTSYLLAAMSRHHLLSIDNYRRNHTYLRRPACCPLAYSSAPTSESSASPNQNHRPILQMKSQPIHFHCLHQPIVAVFAESRIAFPCWQIVWNLLFRPLGLAWLRAIQSFC